MKISFELDINDKSLPFTFDLSLNNLYYINNININILSELFNECCLIGIDTETRPTYLYNKSNKKWRNTSNKYELPKINLVSLLQIGIRTNNGKEVVVIIDLLDILKNPSNDNNVSSDNNNNNISTLDNILKSIFINKDIIKVGQGLEHDMEQLHSSYPFMDSFNILNSIIETNDILKYLHPELIQDQSLKKIVNNYLNCNLIKTQQCSDWGVRPLSNEQIQYASCDALVLLRLYDVMSCEAEEYYNKKLLLNKNNNDFYFKLEEKDIVVVTEDNNNNNNNNNNKIEEFNNTNIFNISFLFRNYNSINKKQSRRYLRKLNSLNRTNSCDVDSSWNSMHNHLWTVSNRGAWQSLAERDWYKEKLNNNNNKDNNNVDDDYCIDDTNNVEYDSNYQDIGLNLPKFLGKLTCFIDNDDDNLNDRNVTNCNNFNDNDSNYEIDMSSDNSMDSLVDATISNSSSNASLSSLSIPFPIKQININNINNKIIKSNKLIKLKKSSNWSPIHSKYLSEAKRVINMNLNKL
jgi:hypothetical protein